ncbi:MAG: quinolinate synthase NadA [bacterium]
MNENDLINKILNLKNQKQALILAHNYQIDEIQKIADILGDSLGLARQAAKIKSSLIVFCGVRFMAEAAKIISPEKTVLLPRKDALCDMAKMIDAKGLRKLKKVHPDAEVVTYVNSPSEVKAESDVCCTSANAVKVIKSIDSDKIIFTPDKNLGSYVQRFVDKKIIIWDGYCYVHQKITKKQVLHTKQQHPDAVVVVHPECNPEVIDLADEVQSTGGMLKVVGVSAAKKFIIGTEQGMVDRLKREFPEKKFFSIIKPRLCKGMKNITLKDLYDALQYEKYKVTLSEKILVKARKSLDRMLSYV